MKIGVFQDIHANLPALKRAVEIFRANDCEKIFHVGDLIGIGPYPKECLDFSFSIKEMEFIMGNHDYWYPNGLPKSMIGEERAHEEWTHEQIGELYKVDVHKWPFVKEFSLSNGRNITFQHYGYDVKRNWFKAYVAEPDEKNLDQLFNGNNSAFVFYGHNHIASDIVGNCRYVNLGSAGCFDKAEVRLGILEVSETELKLEKYSIPYNDDGLMEAFEIRKVPARAFIKKTFIIRDNDTN